MTADPFSPHRHEPDEPSRVRALVLTTFLFIATVFIYQAMDGVQRASEEAERRERVAQSACRPYPVSDTSDEDYNAVELPADRVESTSATPSEISNRNVEIPAAAATTAPVEPVSPAPVLPVSAPSGTP